MNIVQHVHHWLKIWAMLQIVQFLNDPIVYTFAITISKFITFILQGLLQDTDAYEPNGIFEE